MVKEKLKESHCSNIEDDKMTKHIFFLITIFFYYGHAQQLAQSTLSNGSVKDIDGNVYKTVKIGNQWWMAENLKVTHYRNGDIIPNVIDDDEWFHLTSGAYCNYNNDTSNVAIYGSLYDWYAVVDIRNIAPDGWHAPTDNEWQKLVNYLGGNTLAGGRMKSKGTVNDGDGLWYEPNVGATNESGFSALPGGGRTFDVANDVIGSYAYFWSTKNYHSYYGWHRYLHYNKADVYRYNYYNQFGFSVRCIKD